VRDDVLTSIHVKEYRSTLRHKLGAEEITRDIPNLPDDILADLDDLGIVRIGAKSSPATSSSARSRPRVRRAVARRAPVARDLR